MECWNVLKCNDKMFNQQNDDVMITCKVVLKCNNYVQPTNWGWRGRREDDHLNYLRLVIGGFSDSSNHCVLSQKPKLSLFTI